MPTYSSLKINALPLAVLVGAGLLLAAPQAHANLLINGSFEKPTLDEASNQYFTPSDPIPGWEVFGPDPADPDGLSPEIQSNGYLGPGQNASDGSQYLALHDFDGNYIGQEFATTIGQTYYVKFDFSAIANSEAPPLSFDTGVVGYGEFGNLHIDPVGAFIDSDLHWLPYETSFVATTSTSFLGFQAYNVYDLPGAPTQPQAFTYDGNALFDNADVDVLATPEPETWAMMGLGLCSLGFVAWKRRKNSEKQTPVALTASV